MPQFFSNKRLIILLVSMIVLVAMIGFSMKERENISWPEQLLHDTVGWTQSIFYKPANFVAGFFGNAVEMKEIYEQNKVLKQQLNEYDKLASRVKDLKKDNESLRGTLKKEQTLSDYTVWHGTIIGRAPERWYQFIQIDVGKQAGIKPNMAVITDKGLIGKIHKVSAFHSTVELISNHDPNSRISAVVQGEKERVYGLIQGFDQKQKLLTMKMIGIDKELKKGQTVTTSGLGGIFPKGREIGKIVRFEPDKVEPTQTAYIEPAADLYDIHHVMVVKRKIQEVETETDTNTVEEEETS
ncbi:rod shape-determining protein MreC [Pseudalkalibacillus berkeleyi]|uniref:Cell shape-determining protein MreC n=1 Tax=Pseudalkalibacillus berkeleyi TaxID=1069813 RepID=A0ABS9H2F1_9BACL|nr:rod shape-determining protein MreC [Pseudalkalibacillus berkeleyi]MCF6138096.1 rod shape-determining protein MreC [Pseudalkalibacillus berkeleyi]